LSGCPPTASTLPVRRNGNFGISPFPRQLFAF
jgi:hypothetical protein